MESGQIRFKFRGDPFGDKFHPSVREIADGSGDFKASGDSFCGVAEADALYATGE